MDDNDRPRYRVVYCIECGRWGCEWEGSHIKAVRTSDDASLAYCYGPFTYTEPPAYPENWHEIAEEPDPEELAMMNENAELLLAELKPV